MAFTAQNRWKLHQLDVKLAFLQGGGLNEDVYVEQPQGFEKEGNMNKVYKLHKALYGLKQAPKAWFSHIEGWFVKEGFERCSNEHTLFTKTSNRGNVLIVSIYVYDLIYIGNDREML